MCDRVRNELDALWTRANKLEQRRKYKEAQKIKKAYWALYKQYRNQYAFVA